VARHDFPDEIVRERAKRNRGFPELVDAATERRSLLRELAKERESRGITQTAVAAEMKTSQSAVARIESGQADVKMSTLERYAAAVGKRVRWQLVDAG
jgi:ribosome-binding protein aMBF1 (putative translation factor)